MRYATLTKWLVAATVAAMGALISTDTLAVKVGPVEDPIRVIKVLKGEPIVIGTYLVLSGPDSQIGIDQLRGAEIALDDHGPELVGHPVKYLIEDDQCNPEGGQIAASKLAANQQVALVVGPTCSSSAAVGAPILWQAGIPSIGVSSSSPVLTAPDRDPSYHGFLRVVLNDGWMATSVAEYARNVLKLDEIATIHDGSVFAEKLVKNVEKGFIALGGKVCASEAVTPTDVEFRPMLTSIATCKPKWIYMPIFLAASAHIARQSKEISGLEDAQLVGVDSALTRKFIEAAGTHSIGFQFASPAFDKEQFGAGYDDFVVKYKEKYGEDTISGFHVYGYDAMTVGLAGIEKVAVKDDAGNTYIPIEALRDALYATKNHAGLSGPINCDQYGDCGRLTLAVYEFVSDDPEIFGVGTNPIRIFPEKF